MHKAAMERCFALVRQRSRARHRRGRIRLYWVCARILAIGSRNPLLPLHLWFAPCPLKPLCQVLAPCTLKAEVQVPESPQLVVIETLKMFIFPPILPQCLSLEDFPTLSNLQTPKRPKPVTAVWWLFSPMPSLAWDQALSPQRLSDPGLLERKADTRSPTQCLQCVSYWVWDFHFVLHLSLVTRSCFRSEFVSAQASFNIHITEERG